MIFLKKHLDIVRANDEERKKIHKECCVNKDFEPYYKFVAKQIQGVPKPVLENYLWCFVNEKNPIDVTHTYSGNKRVCVETFSLLPNGDIEYIKKDL